MYVADMEELIPQLDSPAHLKDVKSGRYIITNQSHAKIYGLSSSSELLGMTIHDLDCFMHKYWGNNVDEMNKIESSIINSGSSVRKNARSWLNIDGHLWVHNVIKTPIRNNLGKISAILTITDTLNTQLPRHEIFNIYLSHYKSSQIAIIKFLEQHNILRYFVQLPTKAELNILLTKIKLTHNKLVAQNLYISLKTVETHMTHLYQKSSDLKTVIELLS